MRVRFLALVVASLATSNCMLLSGRCIFETRALTAEGRAFAASGVELAFAQIHYGERRDSDPDKDINWQVQGPTLKGHVLSARLKEPGVALPMLDLALAPDGRSAVAEGTTSEREGTDLDGFWLKLSSGETYIEVITDLPSTVSIPLTVTYKEDWSRPYCS